MKIKLHSYAQMTDYFPAECIVELEGAEATVKSLREKLVELNPSVRDFLPSVRFACRDEFVQDDFSLEPEVTVDALPPSSGG